MFQDCPSPGQLPSLGKDRDRGPPGRRPPSRVRSPDGSVADSESIQRSNSTSALLTSGSCGSPLENRLVERGVECASLDRGQFDRVWFLNLPTATGWDTVAGEEEDGADMAEKEDGAEQGHKLDLFGAENTSKRRGKMKDLVCVIV